MVWNSTKKAFGKRKIRKLLEVHYDGEVPEELVGELYPLLDKVGYDGLEQVAGLSSQIARYSAGTAVRLLEKSPELIEQVLTHGDKELVMQVYSLCRQVARDTIFVAARLLDESPELVERLLKYGDKELVKKVYGLSSRVVEYNLRTGVRLLGMSPELVDRVGYDGLERVAGLSSRIGKEHSDVAVRLIEMSPELIDRVGYEGLDRVASLSSQIGKEHSDIAVRLIEMSPELIDRVGYEGLERVAGLSIQIARYNWRTGVSLLGMSSEFIDRVGYDRLEEVAAFCSQIAREDSFVAARMLDMSPELVDRVGNDCLERIADLCRQVNRDDGFIAAKLLGGSPKLIARLLEYGDNEFVTSVYGLCCQVAEDYNWRTAVRLLTESPELSKRLHKYGDNELVNAVYAICTQVAECSGRTAVSLIETSPELIGRVGYDGFEKVAARAAELAKLEVGRATSFVRGESSEYAAFIDTIIQGLELKKIKPVLANYLNALLGYRIEIAEAQGASTDGERIYLPERIQEFSEEDRNFILYKVLATHEEAHLEYGSFDFELMRVQDVVSRIRAKYGGERKQMNGTSDVGGFYELFPEPTLARDLTTVLEDYRINSRLQTEYPVLGEHIVEMNVHVVSKRLAIAELANDKQRAVELIGQRLIAGTSEEQVPENLEQAVDRALSISHTLSSPNADVHETARVAVELYFLIDDLFQGLYKPVPPFSASLDQSQVNQNIGNFGRTARKISEKLESKESRTEQDNEQMQTVQQSTSSSQYAASEEAVKKLLRALFKEKGVRPKEVESRIDALESSKVEDYLSDLETLIRAEDELQSERDTYLYHEWGSDIGDYRPNWSRIRERAIDGGSNNFYLDTIQKYAGLIKCIRREFQMLRPEGLLRLKRQFDGDDIDLDAAVQYFIDKRLRLSPSERNYVRTEKRLRDMAVAFLVDVSGSTGGATIACEKEALILMSEALRELGDSFAIYGFSGHGRDNVTFYKIKDFDDFYDERVQSRISILTNERSTRIAPAIRHTTVKLRSREEKIKLIILLSDGKPLDTDYHGDYAIADTGMALREAQRYGIKSFCITVDREAAEYLPRMYANSRWVVIDDVLKLPDKITRIYRLFTT